MHRAPVLTWIGIQSSLLDTFPDSDTEIFLSVCVYQCVLLRGELTVSLYDFLQRADSVGVGPLLEDGLWQRVQLHGTNTHIQKMLTRGRNRLRLQYFPQGEDLKILQHQFIQLSLRIPVSQMVSLKSISLYRLVLSDLSRQKSTSNPPQDNSTTAFMLYKR